MFPMKAAWVLEESQCLFNIEKVNVSVLNWTCAQTEGQYCAAGCVVILGASEISEKSKRKETSLNICHVSG